MRTFIVAGIAAAFLASAPADAKKKATSGTVKRERETKIPRSDDKSKNEGAQGRRNATEDAARASQGRWNERGLTP